MCKSAEEIEGLDPDSTDVYKKNIVDRYVDRPNACFKKGNYAAVDCMCLALFASCYYDYYSDNNDYQPDILTEITSSVPYNSLGLPVTLPLMSSSEKLKCHQLLISYTQPRASP